MNTIDRIIKLMESEQMNQADLAKVSGARSSSVSDWLKRKSTSYLKYIDNIAKHFNVSVDYLLGVSEEEVYDVNYSDEYTGTNLIGEYLRESRESRGIRLEELSQMTGVPEKILKEYESGEREVKSNIFGKILNAYSLTELDFQNEHNILTYEARPEFNGDYNKSLDFEKAVDADAQRESALNIPESLRGVLVAFNRGEFEDLTQQEVDALAKIAETLKQQRTAKGE